MSNIVEMEEVNLIYYHDGRKGHLNDNQEFIEVSNSFEKACKEEYRAVEYYDKWVIVYKFEDKWGLYFTVPFEGAISLNRLDAYLIESYHFHALWKYYAKVINKPVTNDYFTEILNETVNHFSGVSSEKLR